MAGTDGGERGVRRLLRSMRGSVPVNKGSHAPSRRLPQIDNPVLIGVAGLGALGAGIALRSLRPSHRSGRSERIRMLVTDAVERDTGVTGTDPRATSVEVQVHEAFGKPPLVSIDIRLESAVDDEVAADALDRAARAAWDNPEIAPVAVRGRVLLGGGAGSVPSTAPGVDGAHVGLGSHTVAAEGPAPKVLADMTSLGCEDETARPADLYARYGSPASDPAWRP